MIESFVHPKPWKSEVIWINFHIGEIAKIEFGYSKLGIITKALLRLNLKGRAEMNNINEKGKCKYGGE